MPVSFTLGLARPPFSVLHATELGTQPLPKPEFMKLLFALVLIPLSIGLAGCGALAEVAYDDAVQRQRAQCEKLVSMSERQSCMQRVNTAKRQAEEERKK